MTQEERRLYLIKYLKEENTDFNDLMIPANQEAQKSLLRSLMNIRLPKPISNEYLEIEGQYLKEELQKKGVISLDEIPSIHPRIYLWKGDITHLKVDGIVNAANNRLLGCFSPCHHCIDNAIHSAAGIQLRLVCDKIMKEQGYLEASGSAKITKAYNLPCNYVIHTVGPVIDDTVTKKECDLLEKSYSSCLELAVKYRLKSVAFCCISTGEFHFPNEQAAQIAIQVVNRFLKIDQSGLEVIFNVFTDKDVKIYQNLLGTNKKVETKHPNG